MIQLSPLNQRRLHYFRHNRRGWWSLWIFAVLFFISLFAEWIANDRPLLIHYQQAYYFPVLFDYTEATFGGDLDLPADYRDPYLSDLIEENGWAIWPLIPYHYGTINYNLPVPAPAPPSSENWLGTDDQGRDVLARLIYGFRLSVLFGLILTITSSIIGIIAGAIQGYLGGWVDLLFQRFIEIWSGLPVLFLIIILSSFIVPSFWWLLGIMLLFSWMALVGVVRAEFLRARNFDYIRAAQALGVSQTVIMFRHTLPNAMVATLTFLPFILNGSITTLTSLDFLGFGLPPGSPSLGELLAQGKANLQAPWLGISAFLILAILLSLLIFIGEAARDAFDPRKIIHKSPKITKNKLIPAASVHSATPSEYAADSHTKTLQVSDLSVLFTHTSPENLAVDRVSFTLDRGQTLAIVGESGSGKSVTALSILQLLPYPLATHPQGQIRFYNTELLGASLAVLKSIRGNKISMIFQEPMTSLNPLHTIEQQVGEVLTLHRGTSLAEARPRILELLTQVGLSHAEQRLQAYPHQLSGGQRQRVMIAMALANEPDLLIADEPTTALDVTIQAQILQLLKELQQKMNMGLLIITHDLNIVRRIADHVCVMQQGKIVESAPVKQLFNAPQHVYTKQLLNAEPNPKLKTTPAQGEPLLKVEQLKVWFPIKQGLLKRTVGYIRAVEQVSFQLHAGQTLGIVGESGSGKTTLALAILRLIRSEGSIIFQNRLLHKMQRAQLRPLRREMQIVFQDPFSSLSPRLSIGQIIGEGITLHRLARNKAEKEQQIIQALIEVGLDPETRHRYPHEFSGGQRQRIAIARVMALKPKLIILDEPTSALDRSVQKQVIELLQSFQQKYQLAYIFISHDLAVIRALSDQLIVMQNGQMVEQGEAQELFNHPQENYTKALLSAAFDLSVNESELTELKNFQN